VSLGHGETDSIADTLAQGTSGDLNTGGIMSLRVARSDAADFLLSKRKKKVNSGGQTNTRGICAPETRLAPYPEVLDVVHSNGIAEEVEDSILEHAAVTVPNQVARVRNTSCIWLVSSPWELPSIGRRDWSRRRRAG